MTEQPKTSPIGRIARGGSESESKHRLLLSKRAFLVTTVCGLLVMSLGGYLAVRYASKAIESSGDIRTLALQVVFAAIALVVLGALVIVICARWYRRSSDSLRRY
jgi:membrane protein DedA with SNARE-associated domain